MSAPWSVRLVDIDYAVKPVERGLDPEQSPLTERRIKQVPVIPAPGPTPSGEKACLHVHGFFHYLLVPYDRMLAPCDPELRRLAEDLEAALPEPQGRQADGQAARVYDLRAEMRTPFYGYHEEPRPFLRVQMVSPHDVDKAARLFLRGFGGHRPRQPHEAHVAYLLQFKVEHNLLGMDYVRIESACLRQRRDAPSAADRLVFGSWSPARRVCCAEVAPEVDAAAEAILNTREKVVNEPLTSTRRLVSSLKQMWEEEALRCEVARDPSPMQGATPPSAAERRRALPAPPKYVASQLEKMAELLAGSTLARREAAAAAAAPTGGDDGDGDDDGGGGGGGGWAGGGE
eukprot:gene11818-6231_t